MTDDDARAHMAATKAQFDQHWKAEMTNPLKLDDLARDVFNVLYDKGVSLVWQERVDISRAVSRAILTTIKEAGWKIVPVEADGTMELAVFDADLDIYWGYRDDGRPGEPRDAYATMLSAAPQIEGE